MTSGGGRVTPRWTELTSSPPSNLGKGEIATSLTGRILYVGRGGILGPIAFRTDYVTPQQLVDILAPFDSGPMPDFLAVYTQAKLT
jgi:hypothetical protein